VAKKTPESLSPAKLKAIWAQISPADWLTLLQEHQPNNRWSLAGSTIKGLCFKHPDSDPSMFVDVEKGAAHCYGSGCQYYAWNPVQFIADAASITYAAALQKIRKRFGVRLPSGYSQNIQQIEDNNEAKRALQLAMNLELCEFLADQGAQKYDYIRHAGLLPWLNRRKLPYDTVHRWPVGVFPTRERLSDLLDSVCPEEKIREAAYAYVKDVVAVPGAPRVHEGSIVFFYYTSPSTIGRLRIRHPNDNKSFYAVNDPFDSTVGYFGLNVFPHLMNSLEKYPLYPMEGEMDVLSVMSHTMLNGLDFCAIATGGSMEKDLDSLQAFGFQSICPVPDNDIDGVGWAKSLLVENLSVERVFHWQSDAETLKISDVDEAIRAYGFDEFYTQLTNEDNFPRNNEWVSERLEISLDALADGDVRKRTKVAADWGSVLRDSSERNAYLEYVQRTHNLDKESILQVMAPVNDNEDAFIHRLKQKLLDEVYDFLSERQTGPTGSIETLLVWSKRKKVLRSLPLASKSGLQAAVAADIGALGDFVREELGEPEFLVKTLNPKGLKIDVPLQRKNKMLVEYFHEAMLSITKSMAHTDRLTELGQGVHWIQDFDEAGNPAVLIANGTNFFHGVVKGDNVTYSKLSSPVAGKYFFRVTNKKWSSNLNSVEDIEKGLDYSPQMLYRMLRKIFHDGWRFQNHDIESSFLAADVLYTTVFSVFKHLSMVDLSGESHSGKTTLLQLIGGKEFPDLRMCEAVEIFDDFTEASVRQRMNGVSLRLMLDEFEDQDTSGSGTKEKRTYAARAVLELLRGMSSGSSEVVRGTPGGDYLRYILHFPVTIGGVYTMRENRDLNRYVHIRTVAMEGFHDPIQQIRSSYTSEQMAELRRGITLCFLPRIPQVLKAIEEVRAEFSNNAALPADMMTRLKNNFLPATVIMKLAGVDYKSFITEFSKIKMEELKEQGGTSRESETIWNHILHTQVNLSQYAPESDLAGMVSLAKILSDYSSRCLLNGTDLGVMYIEEQKWLIVFWQKAVQGILKNSNKYRNVMYPGRLKVIADGDSRVVSKDRIRRNTELLQEIRKHTGGGVRISLDQVSVIDLTKTLDIVNTGEEEVNRDARVRDQMLQDIPGAESETNPAIKYGNFEE